MIKNDITDEEFNEKWEKIIKLREEQKNNKNVRKEQEEDSKALFYKLPKKLLELKKQYNLSSNSVLLYMLMLDRNNITKYKTENNEKYILYELSELQQALNLNRQTVIKALKELEKNKFIKTIKKHRNSTKYILLVF